MLAISGVVLVLGLLVFRWMFLPPIFLLLYMLIGIFGGIGYLVYRGQNLDKTRLLESQAADVLRPAVVWGLSVIQRLVTAITQSLQNRTGTGHPVPSQQPAPSPNTNLSSSQRSPTAPPITPTPTATPLPFDTGPRDALISASLLIPSLIVYGIIYAGGAFDSAYQPWGMLMALNILFVVCVAARTRTSARKSAAVVLAVLAATAHAFVTSPSPHFGLPAMVRAALSNSDSSAALQDLLLWSHRASTLVIVLFIGAWGVARRRNPAWIMGLVGAVALVGFTIWFSEHQPLPAYNWFTVWMMNVGVFLAGCLVCWIADVIARPPQQTGHAPAGART